jgi:hypothetical protein
MSGNITIIDKAEYDAATTKKIGRRTVPVAIELPSGVLTGDPTINVAGTQIAMSYPWTDDDRLCMADMFTSLVWAEALPLDWNPPVDIPAPAPTPVPVVTPAPAPDPAVPPTPPATP